LSPAKKKRPTAPRLTHLDAKGAARMVDVGPKPPTDRRAVARGLLRISPETLALVRAGKAKKGDVIAAARIAGIMAAKRTSELIPLCHPIPLTHLAVDIEYADDGLAIQAIAATTAPTGVEMEALTAVAVAGLTLYDMLKAVERDARLTDVRLVEKSGGKSGTFSAE
jgi:cyclic pyranopterin monophosphate synthase